MTTSPRKHSITANPSRHLALEEYLLQDEPYYLPVADEVEIFAVTVVGPAIAKQKQ